MTPNAAMRACGQKPVTAAQLVGLRRCIRRFRTGDTFSRLWASALLLLGLAGLVSGLPWVRSHAQGREVDPYFAKGAFLMVLASNIKWPEERSQGPFRIVLVRCGKSQIAEIRKAIGNSQSPLGGKPQIENESNMTGAALTNLASAHVLFVGLSVGAKDLIIIQKALASSPILTVTDERVEYLNQGYIGDVSQKEDKVIASVSRGNLQKAGLMLDVVKVAPLVEGKLLELRE